MKHYLCIFLTFVLFITTANAAKDLLLPSVKPKIIGGELASENDWPWMSALVFTYNDISTSLDVAGVDYQTTAFSRGPSGQARASMIDCGIADNQCSNATGKICLIARGEVDFSVKVNNCQDSGGIGAIIFNNIPGVINGTLGENFSGTIPVVAVNQEDGALLLNMLNAIATIDIAAEAALVQSSSCGASFIGEKWLLTAAHCVEDANINLLKVSVGAYDLTNGARSAKTIKQIYMHPDYNQGAAFNNDIALIELDESIDHPAITLASAEDTDQFATVASQATVIGWGNQVAYGPNDEQPANSQPDKLHQVELSLLTNQECKDILAEGYSNLQNTTVSSEQVGLTSNMLCAQYAAGGRGSCQGDSGGPLLINTNQGWQQVGIVSYGVGCADKDFPEVYARVASFKDWIEEITQGIAINSSFDFSLAPKNKVLTSQLTVTNNSTTTTNLAFTLLAVQGDGTSFTLDADSCNILLSKQNCQLIVTFNAKTIGIHKVRIIITSDNENIPTSETLISAQAIAENNEINTLLSGGDSELQWFSGGDQSWQLDNSENAIKSGVIDDNNESAVMLTFNGTGSLSFDWAVSSEENTDNPNEPFDALYLIIDGEEVDFISGEIAYNTVTIADLSDGEHQVVWLYRKDELTSAGKDQGYLKNVIFTPEVTEIPSTSIPSPTPASATSTQESNTPAQSSGGTTSIYLFLLLSLLCFYRYEQRKLNNNK